MASPDGLSSEIASILEAGIKIRAGADVRRVRHDAPGNTSSSLCFILSQCPVHTLIRTHTHTDCQADSKVGDSEALDIKLRKVES